MKIKIEGFQALRKATLEVEGLTFLVGKNNAGKSSTTKAIEAALYNYPGKEFINWDARKCRVEIEFPAEGDKPSATIAWEKSASKAKYTINGEDYEKTGRKSPVEVMTALGIKEIETTRGKYRLNFWKQFDSLFLVAETPANAFEFMSQILEERKILPVLQTLGDEIKRLKEDAIKREGSIEALKEQARVKAEQIAVWGFIPKYQEAVLDASKKRVRLSRLIDLGVRISSNEEVMTRVEGGLTSISSILIPIQDSVSRVSAFPERVLALSKLRSRWDESRDRMTYLVAGVEHVTPALSGATPALESAGKLREVLPVLLALELKIQQETSGIRLVESKLGKLAGCGYLRGRLEGLDKVIGAIVTLYPVSSKLDMTERRVRLLEADTKSLGYSHGEFKKDLEAFVTRLGVCPLCERPLQAHELGMVTK